MDIDISTIRVPELFRKNPPAEKKIAKKIAAILKGEKIWNTRSLAAEEFLPII